VLFRSLADGGQGAVRVRKIPQLHRQGEPGPRLHLEGRRLIEAAEAEYRFRRNGLIVSLVFMVVLAVGIYLKIREIESRE
jgi:hypothetical protein